MSVDESYTEIELNNNTNKYNYDANLIKDFNTHSIDKA